jgi:hypothetical protein
MSLVTWEQLHAPVPADSLGVPATSSSEEVYQMVETRIHETNGLIMPPPGEPALSASDLATLDTWVAAGAPQTDGVACTATDDGGSGVPDGNAPSLACTSDNLTLSPASSWSMPQNEDDVYVCYSVNIPDVDAGSPRHIVGMTPHIDNHSIVHHVLLFEADATDNSGVTSTPAPCNPGGSLGWRIIYGWAPGGGAMQTPPNVGFPYSSASKFIVQVHYNNIKGLSGQTDQTGFSFCTTAAPIQYDADVMAFGSMQFTIQPNSSLSWTCPLTLGSSYEGLHVFAAFPHMHELGTAIETEQSFSNGGIVDLGRNAPWNFNTQIWFPLSTTLHQGDVVTTRCAWQNNTSAPVSFGEYTEDEMCYSFTAYYPALTNGISWPQPSLDNDSQGNCFAGDGGALPVPDGGWVSPADSGTVFTPTGTDAGTDAGSAEDASATD